MSKNRFSVMTACASGPERFPTRWPWIGDGAVGVTFGPEGTYPGQRRNRGGDGCGSGWVFWEGLGRDRTVFTLKIAHVGCCCTERSWACM